MAFRNLTFIVHIPAVKLLKYDSIILCRSVDKNLSWSRKCVRNRSIFFFFHICISLFHFYIYSLHIHHIVFVTETKSDLIDGEACHCELHQSSDYASMVTSTCGEFLGKYSAWWRHYMQRFPHYWPFVLGIQRSPLDSNHKGPVMQSYDDFCIVRLNKLLHKHSINRWLDMAWRFCDVTTMIAFVFQLSPSTC